MSPQRGSFTSSSRLSVESEVCVARLQVFLVCSKAPVNSTLYKWSYVAFLDYNATSVCRGKEQYLPVLPRKQAFLNANIGDVISDQCVHHSPMPKWNVIRRL